MDGFRLRFEKTQLKTGSPEEIGARVVLIEASRHPGEQVACDLGRALPVLSLDGIDGFGQARSCAASDGRAPTLADGRGEAYAGGEADAIGRDPDPQPRRLPLVRA